MRTDDDCRAEEARLSKRFEETAANIKADVVCKLEVAGYDAKWKDSLRVGKVYVSTDIKQYGRAHWMRERSKTTRDGEPIIQATIGYGYGKVVVRTKVDGSFDIDKLAHAIIEKVESEKRGEELRKEQARWKRETVRLLKSLGIELDRFDRARVGPVNIEVSDTGTVSIDMHFQHDDSERIKQAIESLRELVEDGDK